MDWLWHGTERGTKLQFVFTDQEVQTCFSGCRGKVLLLVLRCCVGRSAGVVQWHRRWITVDEWKVVINAR